MVKSKNDILFEILILVIITFVGLLCLIPILFVISYSLTPMEEVLRNGGFVLLPRKITLNAYRFMLKNAMLISALKNPLNAASLTFLTGIISQGSLSHLNHFLIMLSFSFYLYVLYFRCKQKKRS